jgi:predicted acetyltransferase
MIEIRTTAPEEFRAASATVSTALLHAPASDDDWAKASVLPSWEGSDSLSAWDGDRCVGHASGFRFDTLVPGGAWLPTNGVTRVGVLGTHRRQGLLRAMLTRLLVEGAERGQVLASLRASETTIYQRFGFGLAGEQAECRLVPRKVLPIRGTASGSFRLLRTDEILDTVKPIYERAATRPGVISRPDWMWVRYFQNATEIGGDAEFVVVHTSDDGVDDGFAHYAVKWKTANFTPAEGEGEIYDLWGTDASVELALWDYLCNLDLVREWYAEERPVDDAIQMAVTDRRGYEVRHTWDEQWLRILDVDAALAARSYAEFASAFTVSVTDDIIEANNGVWEISSAGAKRTSIDATDADIATDIGGISAAYLGGPKWTFLADAARIEARNPASLTAADALFAVPRAPYCCSGF